MLYRSGSESYQVAAQRVDLSNYFTKDEVKRMIDSQSKNLKDLRQQCQALI